MERTQILDLMGSLKLIDRQMERAAVSAVAGFAQIYGAAAQGLSY